jgi:thioredoxin-like negative regulator of GroEL
MCGVRAPAAVDRTPEIARTFRPPSKPAVEEACSAEGQGVELVRGKHRPEAVMEFINRHLMKAKRLKAIMGGGGELEAVTVQLLR